MWTQHGEKMSYSPLITTDTTKVILKKAIAKDRIFYIEFIDNDKTKQSIAVIKNIKKTLFNNAYILKNKKNIVFPEVTKIKIDSLVMLSDVSNFHPTIHKFIKFDDVNLYKDKITVTINNKPINDSIPNFNFKLFKKVADKKWKVVANPGNFRFIKNTVNEEVLTNWMLHHISGLTFK